MTGLLLAMFMGLTCCQKPSFDVAGSGPVLNVFQGDQQADVNASAHIAWAIALPLAGEAIAGRKGLAWATGGWITFTLVSQIFFHPSAGPETRTRLVTMLVPATTVFLLRW